MTHAACSRGVACTIGQYSFGAMLDGISKTTRREVTTLRRKSSDILLQVVASIPLIC
jgi:hypothetical protein